MLYQVAMKTEEANYPLKDTKEQDCSFYLVVDQFERERKECSRKGAKAQRKQGVGCWV
jgi:hypothetical protein